MRSLEDVRNWLSLEKTGTCETAAAPFWRLLNKYRPDIQTVTIRRPVEEVVESLIQAGLPADISVIRKTMTRLDHKLDQIEGRLPNVRSIPFDALEDEQVCAELFELCTPYAHDTERWRIMNATNIQTNFPAQIRYVNAHASGINKLWAQARHAMFSDMDLKPDAMQSAVIKEEPVLQWLTDCQHLFNQHLVDVDEHPDNWINKNLALFEKLYDHGFLQVMVARSNGKPFGYLMTLLSPSLESPGRMIAQHTTFYAAKEFPGLGLKLQRAALRALKEKGIYEVFARTGVRGSGDRTDILYKRLGAQDFGRMYRMGLEN
jgi:hypothetical protein